MWKNILQFLDRLFAVVGALLFAQLPQYYQQYIVCLTGHIGELSYQVSSLKEVSHKTGKTLSQYVQKFLDSQDPDFHQQGVWMQALVNRFEALTDALKNLQESSIFSRPFKLLWYLDGQVASDTCSQFKFGLVLSLETFFYLIIGMFLGYLFYRLLQWMWNKVETAFQRTEKKS